MEHSPPAIGVPRWPGAFCIGRWREAIAPVQPSRRRGPALSVTTVRLRAQPPRTQLPPALWRRHAAHGRRLQHPRSQSTTTSRSGGIGTAPTRASCEIRPPAGRNTQDPPGASSARPAPPGRSQRVGRTGARRSGRRRAIDRPGPGRPPPVIDAVQRPPAVQRSPADRDREHAQARGHSAGASRTPPPQTRPTAPSRSPRQAARARQRGARSSPRVRRSCSLAAVPRNPPTTTNGPPKRRSVVLKKPAATYSPGPLRAKYHRRGGA